MPSIKPTKVIKLVINNIEKEAKKAAEATKEAVTEELKPVPAETLRGYAGIIPKKADNVIKTNEIDISKQLEKVDKLVHTRKEYVAPTVYSDFCRIPDFLENSFSDFRNHIGTLTLSLKEGIKGGHKESLYKNLTQTIKETLENVEPRAKGRLKGYLNKNGIELKNIENFSSKDGKLLFDVEYADGKIAKGSMQGDGSITILEESGKIINLEKSKDISNGVYKEIYDIKSGKTLLKEVNKQIKTSIPIQSVELDGKNIILGFGDVRNLSFKDTLNPKQVAKILETGETDPVMEGAVDALNLKFTMEHDVENGVQMYNQFYTFDYMHNGIRKSALADKYPPKTMIPDELLENLATFIEENKNNPDVFLYKIPGKDTAFIFKNDDIYYMLAGEKTDTGMKISSLFPATRKYLKDNGCVLERVPNLTKQVNRQIA